MSQSLKKQGIGSKKSPDGSSTFYVLEKNLKLEFEKQDHPLRSMIDKFELRPSQLTIKQVLGSGASGIVRLGSLRDSNKKTIDVAIKMLKGKCASVLKGLCTLGDVKNFLKILKRRKNVGNIEKKF